MMEQLSNVLIATFLGQFLIVGGVVSTLHGLMLTTVTEKEHTALFPVVSLAVYDTLVTPIGKHSPDLWL